MRFRLVLIDLKCLETPKGAERKQLHSLWGVLNGGYWQLCMLHIYKIIFIFLNKDLYKLIYPGLLMFNHEYVPFTTCECRLINNLDSISVVLESMRISSKCQKFCCDWWKLRVENSRGGNNKIMKDYNSLTFAWIIWLCCFYRVIPEL